MAPTGVSPAELNDYQVCSLHARILWGIIGSTFDRGFRSDLRPGFGSEIDRSIEVVRGGCEPRLPSPRIDPSHLSSDQDLNDPATDDVSTFQTKPTSYIREDSTSIGWGMEQT